MATPIEDLNPGLNEVIKSNPYIVGKTTQEYKGIIRENPEGSGYIYEEFITKVDESGAQSTVRFGKPAPFETLKDAETGAEQEIERFRSWVYNYARYSGFDTEQQIDFEKAPGETIGPVQAKDWAVKRSQGKQKETISTPQPTAKSRAQDLSHGSQGERPTIPAEAVTSQPKRAQQTQRSLDPADHLAPNAELRSKADRKTEVDTLVLERILQAEKARLNPWTSSKTSDVLTALTADRIPLRDQPQRIQDYWNWYRDPQRSIDRLKTKTGVSVTAGVIVGSGIIALEAGTLTAAGSAAQSALLNLYTSFPRAATFVYNTLAEMSWAPTLPTPAVVAVAAGGMRGPGMMAMAGKALPRFMPFVTMPIKAGRHRHHVILRMVFKYARSPRLKAMAEEVSAVYLSPKTHLSKLHPRLNKILKAKGLWRDRSTPQSKYLTNAEVKEAIETIAEFYASEGKWGMAVEVWKFLGGLENAGIL